MGDEADDILSSFKLCAADLKKYETVKKKFKDDFVQCRNVIFERAKFNQRENEAIYDFIVDLYRLAKRCHYDELHDEMIRGQVSRWGM